MGQEKLFPIHEVCLDVVALIVTVLVEEAAQVLLDPDLVIVKLIGGQLESDLIPNIHEFFELVVPGVFKVESCHFLSHNLLNQLLLPQLVNLLVVVELFLAAEDACHGVEVVRQVVLCEDILVLHRLHLLAWFALSADAFGHADG